MWLIFAAFVELLHRVFQSDPILLSIEVIEQNDLIVQGWGKFESLLWMNEFVVTVLGRYGSWVKEEAGSRFGNGWDGNGESLLVKRRVDHKLSAV